MQEERSYDCKLEMLDVAFWFTIGMVLAFLALWRFTQSLLTAV